MSETRCVVWFSAGAASAVAASLALPKSPQVCRIVLDNEHPDSARFSLDVEGWLGTPIQLLRSSKYRDCWDVWEKRRYLNGPAGALCTVAMKKNVRRAFEHEDDLQVFGFTTSEQDRADRFQDNNPHVRVWYPLIDAGMSKADCFAVIQKAGIELPAMYRMGYNNANCVGCVKGGKGYWNKIRRDFPEVFDRMSKLEESIGASCINGTPLRSLNPHAGRHTDVSLPDCGLFCGENGSDFPRGDGGPTR